MNRRAANRIGGHSPRTVPGNGVSAGGLSRRRFLVGAVAGGTALWSGPASRSSSDRGDGALDAFARAARSAKIAGYSISKVQRWLHEKALPLIDPDTGLYRADGHWNYRDTAADCYPFLCWAAHLVDRRALNGPVLGVLEAEQRLCNHVGRIPVRFDWTKKAKDTTVGYEAMVFGASEYVKDGLIAVVEALGKGPWYERMKGIEEDLWKHARIDTPFGKIPSKNVEVNGEQIQALARLFTMTGNEQFLRWAERLADFYLSDEQYVPQRLRDHGCEIIGGLGLLLAVESEVNPRQAERYRARLAHMFDQILQKGCNEDGLMYNRLGWPDSGLSDGWGYNYVAYLCYDMVVGRPRYREHVAKTLRNLSKPAYRDYVWEGRPPGSIDGFADSIEGAIYLLNRVPVPEGFAWVDREMAHNVTRSHEPLATARLWGTMKLESNGVRTVIMHALMHTQGVIARPWRQDLTLGAARGTDGRLAVVLTAERPWRGVLEFECPRHREFMGFRRDWPRMNTLPEWFPVQRERTYRVRLEPAGAVLTRTGQQLQEGLDVAVDPGRSLRLEVRTILAR
ncbi:MAG TPA: hypothetical protein EYH34_11875 [Planctomycetes bacterium]|nr:hypothetical protein [Planctomycetota bacterium]